MDVEGMLGASVEGLWGLEEFPDPREDPKSRSLKGFL